MPYRDPFMQRAIDLSAQALSTPGTEPFGAVVVIGDRIVGEGINRCAATQDPTAHGEVEAIRDACRRLKRRDLSDAVLYSSCEPCALCAAAMHLAGIRQLHYAAGLAESDAVLEHLPTALRRPIDNAALRRAAGQALPQPDAQAPRPHAQQALAVLKAWAAAAG